MAECLRIAKPGSSLLVFCDWRQLASAIDAVQGAGWTFSSVVAWDKTEAARPKMGQFRAQCEFVVTATKGPIDQDVAKVVGCLPGCFRVAVNHREKAHQTGKPGALMEQLVRVCAPGGLVLDPFAGSASTGVAALKTGRRFVGFEMVDEIADVAEARLRETVHQLRGTTFPDAA